MYISCIPGKCQLNFTELKLEDCSLDCLQKSIGGVMVSMLASSAINRRFETQLGQTKDYKIGICCSVLR